MCTPISVISAALVRSAITFKICCRLGQPVMANPRIYDCVTASNGAYVCNGLGYHALGLKIHLS